MTDMSYGKSISAPELKKSSITAVFEQREKYIIIGLTGKTGSGCTTVANLFSKSLQAMKLSYPQPGIDGLRNDNEREVRLLQRYYAWHQKCFYKLRVRDIITSFFFEDEGSWARLYSDYCKTSNKLTGSYSCDDFWSECISKMKSNSFSKRQDAYNCAKTSFTKLWKTCNDNERVDAYRFLVNFLPEFSDIICDMLGVHYTRLFQLYGNELRFWGKIMPTGKRGARENILTEKIKYIDKIIQVSSLRRNSRDPHKWPDDYDSAEFASSENSANTIFTIAERINRSIKILSSHISSQSEPIAIVIDSMKNIFESNYLKDRYTAYYLLSVTKDESLRVKSLMESKKQYSQSNISEIDYNERPGESRRNIIQFAKILLDEIEKKLDSYTDECKTNNGGDQSESSYCKAVCDYLRSITNRSDSVEESIMLYAMDSEKLNTVVDYLEAIRDTVTRSIYSKNRSQQNINGLSQQQFEYYYSIIRDPLRIFLYITNLYTLYLQDVETCIQNSDIFLTNNEANKNKPLLKQNIVRYISLMMHPGLVPPTPIERCMQIAYTAKVNSGCISRQVGALVTDSKYQILSLNWNDVPCGQTSCIHRNLTDVFSQRDLPAYSEYETDPLDRFQRYINATFDFPIPLIEKQLGGLPACYCFKDMHERLTGSKNPMNARSMHGEEKALLLCDQQRVIGGFLFTTSSPCEMCAKNAKEHRISKIYYIEPYPGISQKHTCNSGESDNRAEYVLFEGAIGRAYTQLYTPILPYKDELELRGFPESFVRKS